MRRATALHPPCEAASECLRTSHSLLDIALNFNTAYVQHAILHTRKPDIARHYASRWLWVDAVGSIPWELIEMVAEAASGSDVATADVVGAFKVLKVPKLLRMGRLFKFLERFEGAANAGRIFLLMLLMTLIVRCASVSSREGARPRIRPRI